MTLPRKGSKAYDAEEKRERRYLRLIQFAEENEAELLEKIRLAFFDLSGSRRPDLNDAAGLAGMTAAGRGWSFHEALISLAFICDFPGYRFHWRRNDLERYTPKLCPDRKTKRPKGSSQSLGANA